MIYNITGFLVLKWTERNMAPIFVEFPKNCHVNPFSVASSSSMILCCPLLVCFPSFPSTISWMHRAKGNHTSQQDVCCDHTWNSL